MISLFGDLPLRMQRRLTSPAFVFLGSVANTFNSNRNRNIPLKAYLDLSKSKLSAYVGLSALPGYFILAPAGAVSCVLPACVFVGTTLAAGSASALNQLLEVERDAVMARTGSRPLVIKKLSKNAALAFAVTSGGVGTAILAATCPAPTAALAAFNVVAYAGLYTPLKVRTEYNTHVGAIVGSIPTLLGCTAAQGWGALATPEAWALFAIQVLWQFPHFYSLAWLMREDYLLAGFRMFPLHDETGKRTAERMFPYLLGLALLPTGCCIYGMTSWMFILDSLLPNAYLMHRFRQFQRAPAKATASAFFYSSLWHLLTLMVMFSFRCERKSRPRTSSEDLDEEAVAVKPFEELRNALKKWCIHCQIPALAWKEQALQKYCPFPTKYLQLAKIPFSSSKEE